MDFDGKLGSFVHNELNAHEFVRIFEPTFDETESSSDLSLKTPSYTIALSHPHFSPSVSQAQPLAQEALPVQSVPRPIVASDSPSAPSMMAMNDAVHQITSLSVTLFVTIRGKADEGVSYTITACRLWDWTFEDVVAKFAPKEYLEALGTTFELWDVVLDNSDVIPKPGFKIFGYHLQFHNHPLRLNIRYHKELIVIPMQAQGKSLDQRFPDTIDIDPVPTRESFLCEEQVHCFLFHIQWGRLRHGLRLTWYAGTERTGLVRH